LFIVKRDVFVSVASLVVVSVEVEESLDNLPFFDGCFDDVVNIWNPDAAVEGVFRIWIISIQTNGNKRTLLTKSLATAFGKPGKLFAATFVGTAITVFVFEEYFDIDSSIFDFLFEGIEDFECAAGNATGPSANDDSATCPFHGMMILIGTTFEKFFGYGHCWRKIGRLIFGINAAYVVIFPFLPKKSICRNYGLPAPAVRR